MALNSKSTLKKVSYFAHFPSKFLQPYGPADEAPSEETIFRRIASYSCEWLLRPRVALSQFASTMNSDLHILKQMDEIMNVDHLNRVTSTIEPFLQALQLFDTTAENFRTPNAEDFTTVTQQLLGTNETSEKLFRDAVLAGGALFSIGINYAVAKALMNNPQKFAELSNNVDEKDSSFKNVPTQTEMMQYLQSTCVPPVDE